jgi:hypothetical protein
LHSSVAPTSGAHVLWRSIDEEALDTILMSGYRSDRPLLGVVGKDTFRLQKRRCSRNDLAGHHMRDLSPSREEQESKAISMPSLGEILHANLGCQSRVAGDTDFCGTLVDVTTGSHPMIGGT